MDEKTKETLNSVFEKLTDEQKEKVNACKNADELMKLLGEWGVELSDDMVEAITGGYTSYRDWKRRLPVCF